MTKRAIVEWSSSVLLISCLMVSGCALFKPEIKRPAIELQSVELIDPSLTALTLVVGIRVDNPNRMGVRVKGLSYQLDINQRELAGGNFEESIRLPGREKTVVQIPVRVSYARLAESLSNVAKARTFAYRLKGVVNVSGHEVPYDVDGSLPLPKFPTLPSR